MTNRASRVAVTTLAAAATVAAPAWTPAHADGRRLTAEFCTNANAYPKPGACIALSYGEQTAEGYTNSPSRVLRIRPGVYWLSVDDNAAAHNFSLESPDGTDQDLTGVAATPGWVTFTVNLRQGTWVLLCDPHESFGMYVDIEVGGVGQDG